MSKIKEAVERKFPRYRVALNASVWCGTEQIVRPFALGSPELARLVKHRNELIDKLIEAAELLAKAQGALIA